MCLLALFFRVFEEAPLVVGANREEVYDRGGEAPQLLDGPCRAVAGVDPVARGTWLGVNEHGVFVALTNRPKSELPSAPRSRGLLVRELLGSTSAAAAIERGLHELERGAYAGCNLLCADRDRATVVHAGDWLRVRPLPPGLHALTSHDVNDASDRRLGYALGWLSQRRPSSAAASLLALQELCAQPGNGNPPLCLHGERSGTVSSSIIALYTPLWHSRYLHAQGPPDRTPYADYSPLLQALFPSPSARE